jgi:hypothetical protein
MTNTETRGYTNGSRANTSVGAGLLWRHVIFQFIDVVWKFLGERLTLLLVARGQRRTDLGEDDLSELSFGGVIGNGVLEIRDDVHAQGAADGILGLDGNDNGFRDWAEFELTASDVRRLAVDQVLDQLRIVRNELETLVRERTHQGANVIVERIFDFLLGRVVGNVLLAQRYDLGTQEASGGVLGGNATNFGYHFLLAAKGQLSTNFCRWFLVHDKLENCGTIFFDGLLAVVRIGRREKNAKLSDVAKNELFT